MSVLLSDLHRHIGGLLLGDPSLPISQIASLQEAGPGGISFLSHDRYQHLITSFKGSALILSERHRHLAPGHVALIIVSDPYLAYAQLTQYWRRLHAHATGPRIHPSAIVHPEAWLDSDVEVGALSVIEAGARIGSATRILSRVTIGSGVTMGPGCLIHPGVVIGADGFGFAKQDEVWVKIEQLGEVEIGRNVEIGANTCVDRAALGVTRIADGVKIDNLVQIGHNVQIGANTAMAGCVGVAGSARIGARCTFGGGAIVLGHLNIVDDVHVSSASIVTKSILSAGHYSGLFPLDTNKSWEKNAASLKQLHVLRDRLRSIEQVLKKEFP